MKHCNKCFEVLPMNNEYFNKRTAAKDNLMSKCRGCTKDEYKNKSSYHSNYRKQNKASIKKRRKEHYEKNKDNYKRYMKIYYQENKRRIGKQKRLYERENRKKSNSYKLNYIHKKRSLISNFTTDQWQQCLTHFNHQCAYCDCTEKLEQEHVIPVSKGGHYTADNIIPACRSCNASKNNKSLEEWYVNQQSYSTLRMDFIKDYLESNSLPILKEA